MKSNHIFLISIIDILKCFFIIHYLSDLFTVHPLLTVNIGLLSLISQIIDFHFCLQIRSKPGSSIIQVSYISKL